MKKIVILDWKRTLYDPDTKKLIRGVLDLLKLLKKKDVKAILFGKGGKEMHAEVSRFKLKKYFSEILFAQGDKNPKVFRAFIDKEKPEYTIVIGDRVRSEITIGNKFKAVTIWVKQGKFTAELPLDVNQEPTYTVDSIIECTTLLKKLL